VNSKEDSTCFHIHTVAVSTWPYAGHVKKKPFPTPKQKQKTVAEAKHNALPNLSCGGTKTPTPT
jgi:hypothetical protein